jgi:hypothetical protein
MSFGTNNTTKAAENNLGGISNTSLNQQLPMFNTAGQGQLNTGAGNVAAGTNFLNTLLQGNRANTSAMLQPSIDQIRQGNAGTLNAINTLMPRGGGRSAALFNQSLQPNAQISNLFNMGRTQAAQALPQIGLAQQGLGANLLGMGNQAISNATGANVPLGQMGLQAQQMSNNLWSGLGAGLLNLATMPLGGSILGTAAGI